MKTFLAEYRHDYTTYTFGYTIYALYESKEDINDLYDQGYLPYTGNVNLEQELYYKSRGLRINLSEFKDSSENRRVDRKVQIYEPHLEIIPIEKFTDWDAFYKFSEQYSEERIGSEKMPVERLKYIVSRKYLSHIIHIKNKNGTIAYLLAILSDKIFHYWFAFYNTSFLANNIPIGKWLMWRGIHLAQELGCYHCYLGNGYLPASQYKTRDFYGAEYYDGNEWSSSIKKLNELCNEDQTLKEVDQFKLELDQDLWLQNKFYKKE